MDLVDYATGEATFLTREKQQKLFEHLRACAECRSAFFDYEKIYAIAVADEKNKRPEFRRKMDALIKELTSQPLPGENTINIKWIEGTAAGQIYELLKAQGKLPVPVIRAKTGLTGYPFYEAMGWLACQEKIIRTRDARSEYAALQPER
jgi:hypothetical protein